MKTVPGKPCRLDRRSRLTQRLYSLISEVSFVPSTGYYNLTISHKCKFIWFRVAKVGTRTILNHLRESEVQLDVEQLFGIRYPRNLYGDYFKFAFVRNPFDRLVSCWKDKAVRKYKFSKSEHEREKMKDFGYFVSFVADKNIETCDSHFRSQSALIDLNNIDYLGRMETFDDDFEFIIQKLHLSKSEVRSRNVTHDRKHYREYYNKETAEIVAQIYQKDLQVFGYSF